MRVPSILVASYLAATCSSLATKRSVPKCTDITLPVSIKAQNLALPSSLNASNLPDFLKTIGGSAFDLLTNTIDIEGTYNMAGTYCEPAVSIPSRSSTLQFLVHGITQTRTYWSALGPPDTESEYSWLEYASSQGYPTFSIDRLGNGLSDHPDGLLTVQIFSQMQVVRSLVKSIKSSTAVGGKSWEKVIYIGHSFGSQLANAYAHSYPTRGINAYILTGYTPYLPEGLLALGVLGQALPAALVLPERFEHLDPSYVVATGALDTIFCTNSIAGAETIVTMVGDCGTGATSKVAHVQGQYPNARNFGF